MTTYRVPFRDLPWETSAAGVLFKAHNFGSWRLRLIEITPDLVHPQWCVSGHVGYVLEGDVEIEFDVRVERYRAGDGVVIPAGEADRQRPRALSARVRIVFVEDATSTWSRTIEAANRRDVARRLTMLGGYRSSSARS